MSEKTNLPKLFISYSHHSEKDMQWARDFAQQLAKREFSPWLDQWEIKPGEDMREAIAKGLRQVDALVLLLTADTVGSPYLFFEIGAALALEKKVIPVVSADVDRSTIPIPLLHRRFVSGGSPEQAADEVARAFLPKEQ